eukprot:TRINITY_DN1040_c0_g1_i1.p1 TRINITY_DN1040_c0_g1~~TRINITY_DN1040_c0_g1_i1.p1  ORF type:complete len:405 (+),score=130.91 TRINITY_DN1040_c0_g1_i1:114-1328(+)
MAGGPGKYPPSEFSQMYGPVLAPKGKLVSPKDVFGKEGEEGLFGDDVKEKTIQAFKVTVKKCEKLTTPVASPTLKEDLEREKIDQIVECFPHTLPKELPDILQKSKWSKPAKEVETWETWWDIHQKILKSLKKQTKLILAWWEFCEIPCPGEEEILNSLKRLVSGVLTHPITIGLAVTNYTPKRKKNYPKSVHLVGTDRPEATMIYAGFYHEILASNPLHPIKLTLVSPDDANQQLAKDCSPDSPMLINPKCKLTAWDGLYHDFWEKYITTQKVEQPDLVVGIHPGLHADGIYEFWEPTLELLLDMNVKTVFTVLSKEEYVQSLEKLDGLFCKYIYKGLNPFGSKHVKQTHHDAKMMWASNQYMIVFKGRTVDLKTLTLIEDPPEDDLDKAEAEFEKLLEANGE